jgi:hypothetical protein
MHPFTEWWAERAAIMQFDGGMDRADADYAAFALTLAYCGRTGQTVPYEGYFYVHRVSEGYRLKWSDETCSVKVIEPRPAWVLWTNEKE